MAIYIEVEKLVCQRCDLGRLAQAVMLMGNVIQHMPMHMRKCIETEISSSNFIMLL